MPEFKTQMDIVNQHLQSLGVGDTVTDKLKIPKLDTIFSFEKKDGAGTNIEEVQLKLPLILKARTSTREEIALALYECLKYDKHIVALAWQVGGDHALISLDNSSLISFPEDLENMVLTILHNILKSRGALQAFRWELGLPYVEVTYENSQFA